MIWLLLMLFVLTAPIYSSVMFFPFKLNGKSKKYKFCTIGLEIAGITIAGRKDAYDNPMNIQELLDKNKVNGDNPIIALSHEPLDYDALSQAKVDLVFSGHTHGIQFPLSYTFLRMANDMVYGHEKFKDMNAIVSSGAGEWGLHYTLPSRNEIVHVKLKLNK